MLLLDQFDDWLMSVEMMEMSVLSKKAMQRLRERLWADHIELCELRAIAANLRARVAELESRAAWDPVAPVRQGP